MRAAVFLLLAGLMLASTARAEAPSPPLRVVATIGMIGDIAERVGGECVEVTTLMGPGVDPHLYQASAGDVRTFRQADTILHAGYSLEGRLGEVLTRFGRMKPTLAVAPESIARERLITVQDRYGVDPHLWMDVGLWSNIVPTLVTHFSEQRPGCAGTFRANGAAYRRELQALDGWISASIATIPARQRILVTAHDAFGYYGRAYAIEVVGIQGISTETETGVADIRRMARIVSEWNVPALFIESTINPRTVQAVINAVRQQGHEVGIGGELYSDAMGEAGTPGGTYIGMLHANTTRIVSALGGEVPALPAALEGWARRWLPASEQEGE
ncbi:manganese/zinc/iron transport system substrate-binding protein [Kushneria sinocarnis]|uniref:Manganese/zinc/iron transport system substrate-binding protein n=1 Tax=Kushneria sinocarnis TaxID=595502 RepID=A0A420X0U3_9GAMM|nr:zinc ABC transporter substrate-binding protein [Kushneria sinocarnis]RKR07478.1 manganese/zinc/iron transport system substrate-binding protein [Kushneria sinocarnis]